LKKLVPPQGSDIREEGKHQSKEQGTGQNVKRVDRAKKKAGGKNYHRNSGAMTNGLWEKKGNPPGEEGPWKREIGWEKCRCVAGRGKKTPQNKNMVSGKIQKKQGNCSGTKKKKKKKKKINNERGDAR